LPVELVAPVPVEPVLVEPGPVEPVLVLPCWPPGVLGGLMPAPPLPPVLVPEAPEPWLMLEPLIPVLVPVLPVPAPLGLERPVPMPLLPLPMPTLALPVLPPAAPPAGCAKAAPDVSATTHVAKASDFKLCI